MLTEAVIGAIVESIVGYALEQSGIADRVRSALGLDLTKRALGRALSAAYQEVSSEYPNSSAKLFDQSFLQHEAVPVLAQLLWRHGRPSGQELAKAWADSIPLKGEVRENGLQEIAPVADRFLELLEREAKKEHDLDAVFDSRALDQTADHTKVLPEIRDLLYERLPHLSVSPRPPGPLRTRIPEPRAVHLEGRTNELDWLCRQLKAGDVAAVAGVRGIGGIGKTELAIAAARALEDHFEGRVIWLDCGQNDVYAIQDRMANAVGAELLSDDLGIRADSLSLALSQQPPTLVVLDDLRRLHLSNFDALTPPRPPCALLITSRRYDLPLPGRCIKQLDVLSPEQSWNLLSSLLPTGWLEKEPDANRQIAIELEHIPLALTLAARRAQRIGGFRGKVSEQPLLSLLDELKSRRLQVLNQGEDPSRPDLSVVITFDASYEDLDTDDQARLRRLGVFARNELPFAAVQTIWGQNQTEARNSLNRLVNAGLIEELDPGMWWMHDLLREYAAERLTSTGPVGEEVAARLAHASYWQLYLDEIQLRSIDDWDSLNAQRPEFMQAASWLLDNWQHDPTLAAELMISIIHTFQSYSFPQNEIWLKAGLEAAKASNKTDNVCMLERSLGEYYQLRGRIDEAEQLLLKSLTTANQILREAIDEKEINKGKRYLAVIQPSLAYHLSARGKYVEAETLYRESLQIAEGLGDRREVAVIKSRLASLLSARGQHDKAERLYRESLQVKERLGDNRGVAVTQSSLADQLYIRGQYDKAEHLYRESLQVKERLGDSREVSVTQSSLASLLSTLGQYDEAEQLYRESIQIAKGVGDSLGVAVTKSRLASLLSTRGQYDEAEHQYRESLRVVGPLGDSREIALIQKGLADLLRTRGQYNEAECLYRESLQVVEGLGNISVVAVIQASLADLLSIRGQYDEAESLYQSGLAICRVIPNPHGIAVCLLALGELALLKGQYDEALSLLGEARLDFIDLQLDHRVIQVDQLLKMAQSSQEILNDLVAMVCKARQGDQEIGVFAWKICSQIAQTNDNNLVVIVKGLKRLLIGMSPEKALNDLPDELRKKILAKLNSKT